MNTRQFLSTAISLLVSVAPVAIVGSRFAIVRQPFWYVQPSYWQA